MTGSVSRKTSVPRGGRRRRQQTGQGAGTGRPDPDGRRVPGDNRRAGAVRVSDGARRSGLCRSDSRSFRCCCRRRSRSSSASSWPVACRARPWSSTETAAPRAASDKPRAAASRRRRRAREFRRRRRADQPAVVNIDAASKVPGVRERRGGPARVRTTRAISKRRARASGSGFIVDRAGYILTNNHVDRRRASGSRSRWPTAARSAAKWSAPTRRSTSRC